MIGAIAIFDEYTFVDVPVDVADQVVSKTDKARMGRTVVSVELKKDSASGAAEKSYTSRSSGDDFRPEPKKFDDKRRSDSKTYGERKPYEPKTYGERKPSEPRTYGDKKRSEPKSYGDRAHTESKPYSEKKRTYGDKKKSDSSDKPRERKKRSES